MPGQQTGIRPKGAPVDTAGRLAASINERLPQQFSAVGMGRLRAAIRHGCGLAMDEGNTLVCAVVTSPLSVEPHQLNRVVAIGRLNAKKRVRLINTSKVAQVFRACALHLGKPDLPEGSQTWAPAATHSFAPIPIGGDIGVPVYRTPDTVYEDNSYGWYNLDYVPEGGMVCRARTNDTVFIAQKLGDSNWATFNLRQWVDLTEVMQTIGSEIDSTAPQMENAGGQRFVLPLPQANA